MRLVCASGSFLDLRDQFDRLFLVLIALLFRFILINLEQLPVAEVFLNNDSGGAVYGIDLGNRYVAVEKQTGYIEIGVKLGIKRFRVHCGYGGALLPADAVVLASGGIGGKRDDFLTCNSLLCDESRKSI